MGEPGMDQPPSPTNGRGDASHIDLEAICTVFDARRRLRKAFGPHPSQVEQFILSGGDEGLNWLLKAKEIILSEVNPKHPLLSLSLVIGRNEGRPKELGVVVLASFDLKQGPAFTALTARIFKKWAEVADAEREAGRYVPLIGIATMAGKSRFQWPEGEIVEEPDDTEN